MQTVSAKPDEPDDALSSQPSFEHGKTRFAIAGSSLFFALLQSVCTFFAALDGLRVAIGIGSLAFAANAGTVLDHIHADHIRIPMVILALLGSLLNLVVLMQVRRLRKRPASQWRQVPLTLHKMRMERMQLVLSLVTLILIGIEEYFHFRTFHLL